MDGGSGSRLVGAASINIGHAAESDGTDGPGADNWLLHGASCLHVAAGLVGDAAARGIRCGSEYWSVSWVGVAVLVEVVGPGPCRGPAK